MPRAILDKTKPCGLIFGLGAKYVYEQDGKKFDADGLEVIEPNRAEVSGQFDYEKILEMFPDAEIHLCFADLGADFVHFHPFLHDFAGALELPLHPLRSKRNMIDIFLQKGKWPGWMHPYCHKELHDTLEGFFKLFDPAETVIMRGGRLEEKSKAGKTKPTRFMEVKGKPWMFFQPLYFAAKNAAGDILEENHMPIWDGYSFGLKRTACRICPGQRPRAYAAIRANFPDVWDELLWLEKRLKGRPC